MGIIQQQTIKGSFYSYLGIAIGFITFVYLQPKALLSEQVGLIGLLSSFSQLFAQFAILGFNGTARYFPFFRNGEKNNHGYLGLACLVSFIGFLVFIVLSIFLKDDIISQDAQKSSLFEQYYWYLIPLTFFTLFFNVFDLYSRMLYDTTSGRILREFVKRIFILVAILLVFFNTMPFELFMPLWLLANILPTVQLALRLYKKNQLKLKPDFHFINGDLKQKLINISLFAILTGSAPIIIDNIDKFMINDRFGLSITGVYTIAFYFGTIITLPARSLYSIAYTIIAESWKSKDLDNIISIYKKSCINQLIASLFIFLGVWANIDTIMGILPGEYSSGRYVIFFIGLAHVIDSAAGVNGVILATSKYFKYDSLFHLGLIGVTIAANLIFIPRFGITGAAIATAITYFVFNTFRYIFILIAFNMQPFSYKTPVIILVGLVAYFCASSLPDFSNYLLNIITHSLAIGIVFGLSIYFFNLSEDINSTIKGFFIKRLKR
ncbi:MAG: polysaccharide biosynthesis protein [Pyrinomonadaceae bacterium]|nr:polysaccharide biosynthesis protein [Sphingobacteriaceae bacterium]